MFFQCRNHNTLRRHPKPQPPFTSASTSTFPASFLLILHMCCSSIHPSFSLSFYHSPSLSIRSGTTSSSLVVKKNNFFFCVFVLKKNVFFLFEVFAFFCLFVAPLPPTTATTTTSSPSPFYPHPYKDFKKDCPPPPPPQKKYIYEYFSPK